MHSRSFLHRLALAAAALCFALPAAASKNWPDAPVHLIVGFPAGSSPDTMARLIAEPLAAALGQPVVVENKAGAGGIIGVQQVARAKGGHTFGHTINGPLTTAQRLTPNLPYNPDTDLAPVALIASSPLVLAVRAEAPVNTLPEFIDWARSSNKKITYGSVGQGSGAHLTMALFANEAGGLKLLHIPFQSYAEVTSAILRGEIDAAFMAPSGALAQYKGGRVKLLGITSEKISSLAPSVPTIAGHDHFSKHFRAELWNAIIAPANTDAAVIERLNREINTILQDPGIRARLLAIDWQAQGGSPQVLAKRIATDKKMWGDVIDAAGIR